MIEKSIVELVDILDNTEKSIQDGQTTFSNMSEVLETLPKIEKEFNRATRFMSDESKIFVDNIEQTSSILVRARNAAKKLLEDNI